MVYYGALSRGCQRCRQRKVKCDQRRPGCLRCEKVGTQCPGFRDLGEVIFRDESQRIIQKARASYSYEEDDAGQRTPCPVFTTAGYIPFALTQPLSDLALGFFFAKYCVSDGSPFSEVGSWWAEMNRQNPPGRAFKAVVEAAGMAGFSNVFHAPSVATKSREQYGRALAAIQQALRDPTDSAADTTLMAVLLLGLFEFITFDSWERHRAWWAHINGAAALMQAHGQGQFANTNPRAEQLLSQLCGQTLYACMQHDVPVPRAIVELCEQLPWSGQDSTARPSPMRNICFRFLRFRTAIKSGELNDLKLIQGIAKQIDSDLEAWMATLPPSWEYHTVDADNDQPERYFQGQRHVYSNLWAGQAWNNWRSMRILVHQVILQCRASSEDALDVALLLTRQLSADICISAASFVGSPRVVSLIWPLSVVARHPSNPESTRYWAIEQLHQINSSMGFRQAGLLADTISQSLRMSLEPSSTLI